MTLDHSVIHTWRNFVTFKKEKIQSEVREKGKNCWSLSTSRQTFSVKTFNDYFLQMSTVSSDPYKYKLQKWKTVAV